MTIEAIIKRPPTSRLAISDNMRTQGRSRFGDSEPKKTGETLYNTSSTSYNNIIREEPLYASSRIQGGDQLATHISRAVLVIRSASPYTTDSFEQRPDPQQSYLFPAGANIGDGSQNVPRRTQRFVLPSISDVLLHFRELIVGRRTTQPAMPGPIHGIPRPSPTMQHEGGQQKSENTKDTTMESETEKDFATQTTKVQTLSQYRHFEAQPGSTSSAGIPDTSGTFSDSDVVHTLRRLNTKAQQNAAYMGDYLAQYFEFKMMENTTEERVSSLQRVSDYTGPDLATSLGSKSGEDNLMLLKIALEACLASALFQITSSLAARPGSNPSINPESLIITGISDILLAAGCNATRSDAMLIVTSQFKEKVASLVDLARYLYGMLDRAAHGKFEVFIARPGERLEDISMEDTEGGGARGSPVLCTTQVGLIKWVPVGPALGKVKKRKVIALKAKVLLEDFLDY